VRQIDAMFGAYSFVMTAVVLGTNFMLPGDVLNVKLQSATNCSLSLSAFLCVYFFAVKVVSYINVYHIPLCYSATKSNKRGNNI